MQKQMRIDTKRNSNGVIELSFFVEGCTPIVAEITEDLEIVSISPSSINETELTHIQVQYYYTVFKTILQKIGAMKKINEEVDEQGEA